MAITVGDPRLTVAGDQELYSFHAREQQQKSALRKQTLLLFLQKQCVGELNALQHTK